MGLMTKMGMNLSQYSIIQKENISEESELQGINSFVNNFPLIYI